MKKLLTLGDIKSNAQISAFIKGSRQLLRFYHYTDHGIDHVNLVSERASFLAQEIGFSKKGRELAGISGFCHDMGNFLERKNHEYWGALLFQSIFQEQIPAEDLMIIMQAIAGHDNYYAKIINPVAAVLILADKSDVRRDRVIVKNKQIIKQDIHNRVNFAVTDNKFKVDKKNKRIILALKIDTNFVPVMEYFEIFTRRMVQCRRAAEFLGYNFGLIINDFKLL